MKKKMPQKAWRRTFALLVLLSFEVVFGFCTYYSTKHQVAQGYIVKNGGSYILLWKGADNEAMAMHYSYLHQALQYAGDELELQIGKNPNSSSMVDSVWSRDELGKRMIYWTTNEFKFPNRMTFNRTYEAEIYHAAFKSGSYTPSPYGHSLSLIPKKSRD